MTVNERLYVSGLMDAFDNAVKEKDKDTIVSILNKVDLNDENIEAILRQYKITI